MKNKTYKIFTIFASVIYSLSLLYLILNLTLEYKHSESRIQNRFDTCISTLKKELNTNNIENVNKNSYINTLFTRTFGDLHDFAAISVYENGKLIYIYSANNSAENDFKQTTSKLIKYHFNSFKINENNYFVQANLYKLKPYSLFYYIRITFLVVLIVTLITIIMIINISFKNKNVNDIISVKTKIENNVEPVQNENYENTNESLDSEKISSDEIKSEEKSDNSDTEEKNEESQEEVTSTSEPILLPSESVKPLDNITAAIEESPKGLFSPVSGFGWEEYLLTRLDSELNRAISSELDLSLFIIKIANLSRESETVKKVYEYLNSAFQFKDLLFEYQEDSIAAIKITMNIDEAVKFADTLHKDIKELLKDSFATCNIGISSRSLRMISGERLLKEASEALIRSQQVKDSPVMGFRADAEKFRKYFENQ